MVKEKLEHIVRKANPLRWGSVSHQVYRKRLFEFLHLDYWKAYFGFPPYNELDLKGDFRFTSDYFDNGKHHSVTLDPDPDNPDSLQRRMVITEGNDIYQTTEWTFNRSQVTESPELNLRMRIGRAGDDEQESGDVFVDGFHHSIMDGILGVPYKIGKKVYNFFVGAKEKVELMELGLLAKVRGVFSDLFVDEDVIRKIYTLGARCFEIRDNLGKAVAYIRQGIVRRWRYESDISDDKYKTPAFKTFLHGLSNCVSRLHELKPISEKEAAEAVLPEREFKYA